MRFVVFIAAAALVLCSISQLPARPWSDSTGKYKVEADLVGVRNGKVYLEKAGGSVISLPLDWLSKEDIRHLSSLVEYKEYFKTHPLPGTEPEKPVAKGEPAKKQGIVQIKVADESKVGEVRQFSDLGWSVKSLAFSPDGRFLAVGKLDRAILLFDVDEARKVTSLDRLENLGQVTALAFTPDGSKLLSGGDSGRIQVWNVAPSGALTEANRFVGHSQTVHTITVSADGKHVLSGGGENIVRCWTLADAREQFAIDGFYNNVKATFITRGGKQGLASDGASLALIDMKQGKVIQTMKLGRIRVSQMVAIAPDGSRVVVQESYAIHSWDIRSGKVHPLFQERGIQWSGTFLPNSKYLLSGGSGKVNLWEIGSQRKTHEFDVVRGGTIKALAASPDNRHFAVAGRGDIQVFRMPAEVAKP